MKHIHHTRSRLWQTVSICLTVVGVLLFIYGSRIAASQSDDKRYVEGIKRQQLLSSSIFAMMHTGNSMQQGTLADSVITFNQTAGDNETEPRPEPTSKSADKDRGGSKAKPAAEEKRPAHSNKHGAKNRSGLGPGGQ